MSDFSDSNPNQNHCVIIIPPFSGVCIPAIGPHSLQACAKAAGFSVKIIYANLQLAEILGIDPYNKLCSRNHNIPLLGERIFSNVAFNTEYKWPNCAKQELVERKIFTSKSINDIAKITKQFINDVVLATIFELHPKIVGCSCSFDQIAASVAILNKIKEIDSSITTIIGGANCEAEMAYGVLSLSSNIDYVFSGESELTFVPFLQNIAKGNIPKRGVIKSESAVDLNKIPPPNFDDYFTQLKKHPYKDKLLEEKVIWVPFETSRGCWWAQKNQCTFCGLNGKYVAFREKDPGLAIRQIKLVLKNSISRKLFMTDCVMPFTYFNTFVDKIASQNIADRIFYEQRPNLTFKQIKKLSDASIKVIQPGIESLSNGLLKIMRKGVTAEQNLSVLKYARALDIVVHWNVLIGFPQDKIAYYEEMIKIVPYIVHLYPPSGLIQMAIHRFSPYFNQPQEFGITSLCPPRLYRKIFPNYADIKRLAYVYMGNCHSVIKENKKVIKELDKAVTAWKKMWQLPKKAPPELALTKVNQDIFLLTDTRPVSKYLAKSQHLSRKQAEEILVTSSNTDENREKYSWYLQHGYMICHGEKIIPLVVMSYDIYLELFS